MLYQYADRVGGLFEFPSNTTTLRSKVGVSWISHNRACSFLDEIQDFDMNATVSSTKDAWNNDVLSKVQVNDQSNDTLLEIFTSALYRMHLLPSNRTGENPNWISSEPYYDDFYTAWDIFRCLTSFYVLVEPVLASDLVRTLIDIWRHERFMPDGRSSNYNGRVCSVKLRRRVLKEMLMCSIGPRWLERRQHLGRCLCQRPPWRHQLD